MKKVVFVVAVVAALVSCKKKKIEKDIDGTYSRSVQVVTYSDSTTQVLKEAWIIDYDRKEKKFAFSGSVPGGKEEVTTEISDRDDSELEIKFDSPAWESMLPVGATPNSNVLAGAKFYLKESGGNLYLSVVVNGNEEVYTYSPY